MDRTDSDLIGCDRMGSGRLAAFNQSNAILVDNMSQMREASGDRRGEQPCYNMDRSYDYIDYIACHPRQQPAAPPHIHHPPGEVRSSPVSRM